MKKLLIIETLRTLFTRRAGFLDRTDITLTFFETNDDILSRHIKDHADLIITTFNRSDLSAEELFSIIRRSPDLKKVLLILVCEDAPGLKERASRSGANVILTLPIDQALLERKIHELLDVTPRKSYRVAFKLAGKGKLRNQAFLCNSENISASGMLVRTRESMKPGDHLSCSFFLPDGMRIQAAGEVVRSVLQDMSTGGTFYGIKFFDISPEHRHSLESFIDREYRHRLSPTPGASAA